MPSEKIKNRYNPAPQGDSSPTPSTRQQPQGSQRRSHKHEHLPEERENPSRQGGVPEEDSPDVKGPAGGGNAKGSKPNG
jgi:hypothetical protein